jgi:hypothetical protein
MRRFFSRGYKNEKNPRNFQKWGSEFLASVADDSGLTQFLKVNALPISPDSGLVANAHWLKKVERYLQLTAFFSVILQIPFLLISDLKLKIF